MTDIQPELWVERPAEAIAFYTTAFAATVVHQVGDGDDTVTQLAIDVAHFWVANADPGSGRPAPGHLGGGTSRTLLVVGDPDSVVRRACAAGATLTSSVGDEHGWRSGRITDPSGHRWEIGKPLVMWPPRGTPSQ